MRPSALRFSIVVASVGALLLTFAIPAQGISTRQWNDRLPIHHARAGLNVEQTDDAILAIGGFDSNAFIVATEARPAGGLGVWRDVATMPTGRANFASAVVGRFIYAAGGYDDVTQTNVVEKYDLRLNRWTTSRPLPQPRGGDAGASIGGLFYVAGGYITTPSGDDQLSASVLAFDPLRNTWTNVAPMQTAREKLRLVAAGRFLYAIGGVDANGDSLTTVERYDPRINTWLTLRPLNESRAVAGVVSTSIAGHPVIVVVGGAVLSEFGLVQGRRTTEVLNIDTGRWHTLDVLLDTERVSLACAIAADGTVLAIGGVKLIDGQVVFVADVDALRLELRDLV